MKAALLFFGGLIAGLFIGWLVWAHPPATATTNPPRLANQYSELELIKSAREKALAANPELATEYKAILQAQEDQEKQYNDALIKMDPKMAPIIAKLQALHLHTIPQLNETRF